jgi:hypothetical protein
MTPSCISDQIKYTFFELSIKFLIDGIPFLGSKGFRLDVRPHKVYFFELSITFSIKSSPNIKIGKYFTRKWKRSQKFLWQLPDGICFWGQKSKLTPVRPIPSVIQKDKSLTWKHLSEIGRTNFLLDSHEITADGRPQTTDGKAKEFFFS